VVHAYHLGSHGNVIRRFSSRKARTSMVCVYASTLSTDAIRGHRVQLGYRLLHQVVGLVLVSAQQEGDPAQRR